ncbi:MAG: deoxyribose-phosphate aldolase [Synergistaceae bacterium]|jgi:deoxyribose-phosphate aldolase|nr:deoxyribose-phosphate aldolase [Synergistaceae bacterium]
MTEKPVYSPDAEGEMDIEKIVSEVLKEVRSGWAVGEKPSQDSIRAWEVASKLEHSLLNPDVSLGKILEECANARRYCVAAVCVAPYYVSAASEALRGSGVKVCAAIGFPHGCMSEASKLTEARECVKNGADELDVAINILAVKSGKIADARDGFEQIAAITRGKTTLKAVFEHSVYSDDEKRVVLEIAKSCGAEFVKIQNVLSGKDAEVDDVRYVKNILGRNVKIKIDGGVKTLAKAMALLSAGAERIGLTAAIAIVKEAEGKL